jgi:hypothetical protein
MKYRDIVQIILGGIMDAKGMRLVKQNGPNWPGLSRSLSGIRAPGFLSCAPTINSIVVQKAVEEQA